VVFVAPFIVIIVPAMGLALGPFTGQASLSASVKAAWEEKACYSSAVQA
jgi:hypothetical protein